MDGLIPLALLVGLFFFLVVPVLAIRANLKLGALEREVVRLRSALLAQKATPQPQPAPSAETLLVEPPKPVEAPEPAPIIDPAPAPQPAPKIAAPPEPARPKQGFEERLGGRI